jgi:hypothetical protein
VVGVQATEVLIVPDALKPVLAPERVKLVAK